MDVMVIMDMVVMDMEIIDMVIMDMVEATGTAVTTMNNNCVVHY